MSDTATLLPSSATSFERDLSASMDPLPRIGAAAELIRNAKDQGCLRQCSDMCLNIYLENGACDYACNVPNCNYDNQQCQSM